MKSRLLFAWLLLVSLQHIAHAQDKKASYTISGYLKDARNGEELIGANVYVQGNNELGTTTNIYGFYSLSLPAGSYQIAFSYLGFNTIIKQVELDQDVRVNMELSDDNKILDEVVITDERKDDNVKSTLLGKEELSTDRIKSIPAFMGEVDIMKAIQLLPGVQAAGEGNSGIYVRGGGPDQNLILLDDAIVYNAGHLFGFFSVFNADAVKNTTLYKGTIPSSNCENEFFCNCSTIFRQMFSSFKKCWPRDFLRVYIGGKGSYSRI